MTSHRWTGLWLVLGLVAVLSAMAALTRGTVAVQPEPWVLGLTGALVCCTLAVGSGRARWYDYLTAGLLGLAATHRLFAPGFPGGHDTDMHLWGLYGFYQAFQAGSWMPRWIHEVGLGMPLLMFYPPLSFYSVLPFLAAGFPIYDAFKAGFVLFSMLSGLSMCFVVNRWTGDRRAALLAAAAYTFAPYHLLQSHYRAAIAEAASMAVLPLFFYYGWRLIQIPTRRRLLPATLWTAVLTLAHPLSLSLAATGLGIWTVSSCWSRSRRILLRSLMFLGLMGGLGVGLAGFYTVPMVLEGRYTTIRDSLSAGDHPMYYWHGLAPDQLLERRAWDHWQKAERRDSPRKSQEMPFYFGITLLALLPFAYFRNPLSRPRGLLTMTVATLLLALYPFDALLAWLPSMTMVMFPWRFLAVASCGAALLAGFALRNLLAAYPAGWFQRLVPGALVALVLIDAAPYTGAPGWTPPYQGLYGVPAELQRPGMLPWRVDGLRYPPATPDLKVSVVRDAYPEYYTRLTRALFFHAPARTERQALEHIAVGLTLDRTSGKFVQLNPAPYCEFFPAGGGPARPLTFERGGERIRVKLPGQSGTLVLKEQWFPGWIAGATGRSRDVGRTWDGLMTLPIDARDKGELSIRFTWARADRMLGWVISLLAVVLLFIPTRFLPAVSIRGPQISRWVPTWPMRPPPILRPR